MRKGSRELESRREMPAPQGRAGSPDDVGQARVRRRDRILAWVFCGGVHLVVLAALFWPHAALSPERLAPPPILVSVLTNPAPPSPPNGADSGGPDNAIQPTLLLPTAPSAILPTIDTPDNSDLLSEAQLAGTASVGEGGGSGGGGGCDLARAVQQALRNDSLVRAAVAGADRLGKATMLWNGDWVRSGSQDGKGLSTVRQAILWEVAFAPQACRNERMHRPVLLSLADGGTRFAIGSGDWRWSDLLGVRGAAPDR